MSADLLQYGSSPASNSRHPVGQTLTGLDALAAGSLYAQRRQQHQGQQHQERQRGIATDTLPYAPRAQEQEPTEDHETGENSATKGSGFPVRRRISRACDQCNSLRTKCDGQNPCAHCKEYGLKCEYARERKKRGKASRKEIVAQEKAQSGAETPPGSGAVPDRNLRSPQKRSGSPTSVEQRSNATPMQPSLKRRRIDATQSGSYSLSSPTQQRFDRAFTVPQTPPAAPASHTDAKDTSLNVHPLAQAHTVLEDHGSGPRLIKPDLQSQHPAQAETLPGLGTYVGSDGFYRGALPLPTTLNSHAVPHGSMFPTALPNPPQYAVSTYAAPSPPGQNGTGVGHYRFPDSPASGPAAIGQSPHGNSPAWLDLPSPSASLYAQLQQSQSQQSLRYPVLVPILPRISSIIPISLACDLLDIYFASASSVFVRPASPYILGFVLRRKSVLRRTDPRPCSRALLASMLWVGAQTSESSYLTSPPSQRGKVCHQLLELTLELLRPLVHTPLIDSLNASPSRIGTNGVAIGGFGIANPAAGHDTEGGSPGATAALDDIITYINLATVVSASEYKAASLRWWNSAWSLARELKLGRELPPHSSQSSQQDRPETITRDAMSRHSDIADRRSETSRPESASEEEREERRRIWWLLYIVDRHLALCYNRPLFLLDVECEGLLQPEDDAVWQAGEYYDPPQFEQSLYRRIGPGFECTGHSMFGYFLPLMCILGGIVDLKHSQQHPRFGLRSRGAHAWQDQIDEISHQLETYGRSLRAFDERYTSMDSSAPALSSTQRDPAATFPGLEPTVATPATQSEHGLAGLPHMSETALQTRIVVAYCTHLMNTLHILVNGKWDPLDLLDDNDLWISSGDPFVAATGHAVAAAEAINDILEYDPDLSFMPFFFGIYLLQGSFLLLLIADKLQGQASPSVVRACEAIVRAHEVCVVTLNTEYQRNFRKVMRSALAQVKGRTPADFGEQQQRRREVLALYRWTGDGTGLAL